MFIGMILTMNFLEHNTSPLAPLLVKKKNKKMQIIDGKRISKYILEDIKKEVEKLDFVPVFCDVLVGVDPASVQYVNMKRKKAESLGIEFHEAFFGAEISTDQLVQEIKKINKIENMCGVIVQLPLPEHVNARESLDAIDPRLDVDALGSVNSQNFYQGGSAVGLPTALACMVLLDSLDLDLKEKNIVVLGYGDLVGKPVFSLLEKRGLNPVALRSQTENKEEILKNTDVIISGIGKGLYINRDMIKEGVVIIDAGTSEEGAGIVGDVDLESVRSVASYVSPVPGGVGPVTIAMLFKNVLEVAKQKQKQNESNK